MQYIKRNNIDNELDLARTFPDCSFLSCPFCLLSCVACYAFSKLKKFLKVEFLFSAVKVSKSKQLY